MKYLFFLSAAALLTVTVNAQTSDKNSIKKDEASLKKQEAVIKKEKKSNRKALRKLKSSEVSNLAKRQFLIDFGNISDAKWEVTSDRIYNMVTFTKDNLETEAFYDYDAKLVGTIQSKTFADLPLKAQQNITKYYKGYTPGAVVFFDDNEYNETDMIMYGNQFEDEDSYFVELQKGNTKIVVHVRTNGDTDYFTRLKN